MGNELHMLGDGQGGEAPTAYRPQAEKRYEEPITVFNLGFLVAGARQGEGRVHELDPQFEGLPCWNEATETILGLGACSQEPVDGSQPGPVAVRGDQARR